MPAMMYSITQYITQIRIMNTKRENTFTELKSQRKCIVTRPEPKEKAVRY
jgi:hypothetical protein